MIIPIVSSDRREWGEVSYRIKNSQQFIQTFGVREWSEGSRILVFFPNKVLGQDITPIEMFELIDKFLGNKK